MNRNLVTLFSGQWVDLGLDDFLNVASSIGFDGVELIFRPNMVDLDLAATSNAYCEELKEKLNNQSLKLKTISAAYIGKLVGDVYDTRHDTLVPNELRGKYNDMRAWAIDEMYKVPAAAKGIGAEYVQCFLGSPIWNMLYSYPKREESLVDEAFFLIAERWIPILDEFDRCGVKLAFETHPSEIAYDYYTLERLIYALNNHRAFAINYDPSHITWQGIDPCVFLRRFIDLVVNVHIKDIDFKLDGTSSIIGSHLPFGDTRRAWNFVSPGHGIIPFERIIRILNEHGYDGCLAIEWEDNGMDRMYGVKDAFSFVKKITFPVSERSFDKDNRFSE